VKRYYAKNENHVSRVSHLYSIIINVAFTNATFLTSLESFNYLLRLHLKGIWLYISFPVLSLHLGY